MKNTKIKFIFIVILIIVICILSSVLIKENKTVETGSEVVSTKKIEWGIKRNETHAQPDVGSENRKILEENNGICLGNKDSKVIYLTFDEGYEAGYTPKILEVLKENDVKAAFFITAHYLNTQEELVKQMLDEGHIVGNHTTISLMSGNDIKIKC